MSPPWKAGPDMTTPVSPSQGPGSQDTKPSLPHSGPVPSTACPGAMWHPDHSFPPGPLVCLLYFTKNNKDKFFPVSQKIDCPHSTPPAFIISTGSSLDSNSQYTVFFGRIFDFPPTPDPQPHARISGEAAEPVFPLGISGGSCLRSSWLAPGDPSAPPEIWQLQGHGEGHDFGGLAQQTTPADHRGGGVLWYQASNPCSKQKTAVFWRELSNTPLECLSSPCVAIHRPGVKVRTPGFYSSSTKALLGGLGQFLPHLFWLQFSPVSTDVSVSETG